MPTKKRKKTALGKGLGALIPNSDPLDLTAQGTKDYFECDIALLHPNRYQPRQHFDEAELEQLSASIKEQGIIQPLIVRKDDVGYELVAGERRLRAAKRAGLEKVPVVVKRLSDTEMLEMSIVENIQRENLNPLEEAAAYKRLMEEFKMTQEQVAGRVGKSRPAVANLLRLRNLPEEIKTAIRQDQLSMGHARSLLALDSSAQQIKLFQEITARGLSVRQTEALVKRFKNSAPADNRRSKTSDNNYFDHLSQELSRQWGSKIQIARQGKKGSVRIEFYSDDDLQRLIDLLSEQ